MCYTRTVSDAWHIQDSESERGPDPVAIQITRYNFFLSKIKCAVILNTAMEWILAIYIFTAGEWQLHQQHGFPDVESCIQAQWEFTDLNPDITQIRASCEQSE